MVPGIDMIVREFTYTLVYKLSKKGAFRSPSTTVTRFVVAAVVVAVVVVFEILKLITNITNIR